MVILVDIAAIDVINIDLMHPHGPRKTFNQYQCGDSCYARLKSIIQKISTPTASTGRPCICQTSAIISFYTKLFYQNVLFQ